MGEASGRIGGAVPGPFVGISVEQPQPLAQVLAARHQIGAIEPEAGPVLENPQALPGPIEIGIQQSLDRLEVGRPT